MNAELQSEQVICKVHDTISDTTTIVITENLMTLARNYTMSYSPEKLDYLGDDILIMVIGHIAKNGKSTSIDEKEISTVELKKIVGEYNKRTK